MDRKFLETQQAAYNLAQLSGKGTAGVSTLVDTLILKAEEPVISMIASANPEHIASGQLNEMDKQALRAILAQIEQMSSLIRQVLTPTTSTHETITPIAMQEQAAPPVPSLTNSQSSDADSPEPTGPDSHTPEKSIPSPAATDDVTTVISSDSKQSVEPNGVDGSALVIDDDLPVAPRTKKSLGNADSFAIETAGIDAAAAVGEDMDVDLD